VHLDIAVRVDAPLFTLHTEGTNDNADYALPISLMAGIMFE
jgi:hypothetical protein